VGFVLGVTHILICQSRPFAIFFGDGTCDASSANDFTYCPNNTHTYTLSAVSASSLLLTILVVTGMVFGFGCFIFLVFYVAIRHRMRLEQQRLNQLHYLNRIESHTRNSNVILINGINSDANLYSYAVPARSEIPNNQLPAVLNNTNATTNDADMDNTTAVDLEDDKKQPELASGHVPPGEIVPSPGKTITLPSAECKICYDEPVQVLLLPCKHAAMCLMCTAKVNKCPLCTMPFTDIVRIYM